MARKLKIDVTKYSWPAILPEKTKLRLVSTHRRIKLEEDFLGPIPAWWIIRASLVGLQQKSFGAVIVGLLLWRQLWFQHQQQPVYLGMGKLLKLGLKRHFVAHGIDALEKAGLISVRRFNYQSPRVTIVTKQKDYLHGQRS
jgi:hypothetical protein